MMSPANYFNLVLLAAIWGGSFLFMRIAVPSLGPVLLIELRVLLAALFLLVVGYVLRKRLMLGQHWRHYLILGGLNSALPFVLLAYAAQTLPASLLSILNGTAPIWGALIGSLWSRSWLPGHQVLGLLLGITGVTVLVGMDRVSVEPGAGLAILAGLSAAISYSLASIYARRASPVEPFANAHGSMWGASFLLLPLVFFFVPAELPTDHTISFSVVMLGVVCSGVAYLLYFKLIRDVGATSALTVTFLVPVFGILWGHVVLNEPVGWHTAVGASLVILGTGMVTGFSPRQLIRRSA